MLSSETCECGHTLGSHPPHPDHPFAWPCRSCQCSEYKATPQRIMVFDSVEWEKAGYDRPEGNDRFYHSAEILEVSGFGIEQVATIKFEHDGRISRGHFTSAMKEIES